MFCSSVCFENGQGSASFFSNQTCITSLFLRIRCFDRITILLDCTRLPHEIYTDRWPCKRREIREELENSTNQEYRIIN